MTTLGPSRAPNIYRLRREGAFTDNARTDENFTNTLPNHVTQVTSRGAAGDPGHGYTLNSDPEPGQTIHSVKGSYVASVFDVVHDHGLSTGLYAGKSKFSIFDTSYETTTGAPDTVGSDDGRGKIDRVRIHRAVLGSMGLVRWYVADMKARPLNYTLLHLAEPDHAGHGDDWDLRVGSRYMTVVAAVDSMMGRILDLVEGSDQLKGNTLAILTPAHGGTTSAGHGDATKPTNYKIPFYVWDLALRGGRTCRS